MTDLDTGSDDATGAGGDPAQSPSFAAMDPAMAANPQPLARELGLTMPVMPVDGMGVVLTGRAAIEDAFRRPDVFSSNVDAVDLSNVRPLIPLQIDPPDHKKYRKLLDPIFAPRQVLSLDEPVSALVNDLIDGFIDDGEVDFAEAFSVPFPSQVFLRLLGLPLDELPRFLEMKDGIIRPDHVTATTFGSDAAKAHQVRTAESIYTYFDDILDQREVAREDDLLSRFIDAEVDGHRLTREDILDICFLFLIAGLDTVTSSLDCMFAHLAAHPDQRRRIVDDPGVIPSAIEELLRWETPVMGVARIATQDTELGGCPIHAGDSVFIMLSSANLDDTEFDDPMTVRLDRDTNRHLAFGGGIHRCLGSHLARAELRVALREWHRRIPDYSVAPGHELTYTPAIRSIPHFPMVFTAAR